MSVTDSITGDVLLLIIAAGTIFGAYWNWFHTNQSSPKTAAVTKNNKAKKIRVLHLAGAEKNEFYQKLSTFYGNECVQYLQPVWDHKLEFIFCVVHPVHPKPNNTDNSQTSPETSINDIFFTFPSNLQESTIFDQVAKKYTYDEAVSKLGSMNIDCAVNHMFDPLGCSKYRDLLEYTLNIPFIGSSADIMDLTNDKQKSKILLKKHGVSVPRGVIIDINDIGDIINDKDGFTDYINNVLRKDSLNNTFPLIVKANTEDNSIGLGVANNMNELILCINNCSKYDNEIIIEEYISLGKEVRMGVIEGKNNKLIALPVIVYNLAGQKTRNMTDKLEFDKNGIPTGFATSTNVSSIVGNKYITNEELNKLIKNCILSHKILKCRDFSLYDIRIDPNGIPYILEANLFCGFAPKSILVRMATNKYETERDEFYKLDNLFMYMIEKAVKRKRSTKEESK